MPEMVKAPLFTAREIVEASFFTDREIIEAPLLTSSKMVEASLFTAREMVKVPLVTAREMVEASLLTAKGTVEVPDAACSSSCPQGSGRGRDRTDGKSPCWRNTRLEANVSDITNRSFKVMIHSSTQTYL